MEEVERKSGSLIEMLRQVEKLTNGVKRIKLDDGFNEDPLVKHDELSLFKF